MSARNFCYTHPDSVLFGVTPTLPTGTLEAGYQLGWMTTNNPAKPTRFSTTTFRTVYDMGEAKEIALVAFIHHNYREGLTGVRLEMNATSDFTTPSFSLDLDVPAWQEDRFPTNILADLREVLPTFRYLSHVVSAPNDVACSLGEIVAYPSDQVFELDGSFLMGKTEDDEEHPVGRHETEAGVQSIITRGTRKRWLRGEILTEGDLGAQIRSWRRSALGSAGAFLILPPDLNNDEPWFVRFEKDQLPRRYVDRDEMSRWQLDFEEVGRGLYPTPSPV